MKVCKFNSEAFNSMQVHNYINRIDRSIGLLKRNKVKYTLLVITLALILKEIGPSFAAGTYDFENGLNDSCDMIVQLLLVISRYVFLGLGLKELVTVAISGGTFKDMASESSQYLLGYLFIKIYPTVFDIFSKIKF